MGRLTSSRTQCAVGQNLRAQAVGSETRRRGVSLLLCGRNGRSGHRRGDIQEFERGENQAVKIYLSLIAAVLCVGSAQAHDPYEISSAIYLQTNRIELFVEMEFAAGMKLAGLTPTKDVAVLSQFEAGQARLLDAAGSFYEITAANNLIQIVSTNVELGVEDHIRFHVEFANTAHRPLRFVARSLKSLADQGGFGASLVVLDMVNKKVLGQTTIFADSPTMEFTVTNQAHAQSPTAVTTAASVPTNDPPDVPSTAKPIVPTSSTTRQTPLWLWIGIAVGIALLTGMIRSLVSRK